MAPSSHRPAPPAYVSTTRFPIRPTRTRRPPAPNPSTQHPAPSTPPRRPPFMPTAGSLPGEIPLSPTRGGDHTLTPTPTPTPATHPAASPSRREQDSSREESRSRRGEGGPAAGAA